MPAAVAASVRGRAPVRAEEQADMRAALWCVMTVAALAACGKPAEKAGERGRKASMASIASFDPDEAVQFDLEAYGTDRPDQYGIEQAFATKYGAFDECVAAAKQRKKSDRQLPGDVSMAIKLNPKSSAPFAVNAEMPDGVKDSKLKDCLREAAAAASYPTYDGPPVVVKFNFELDPGGGGEE